MINLLPYEDKKEVEREGLRRFLIVALLSLATVIFLGILLMGPVYLLVFQQRIAQEDEELSLRNGKSTEHINQISNEIKKINSKLFVFESNAKNYSAPKTIKGILDIIPSGIKLTDISFEVTSEARGRAQLRGNASTRENLLNFLKVLNDSGLFSKVDSPVSNILKKTDVDFSINLEIK